MNGQSAQAKRSSSSQVVISIVGSSCCRAAPGRTERAREASRRIQTVQSHGRQIGLGIMQYFDDWNGQFFLHHPFDADSLSQVGDAESFAEIYWEDKIMPYVNQAYANDTIAKGGTQVYDEKIFRCLSDTSVVQPYVDPTTGLIDGITNRTSYILNSQLSHKALLLQYERRTPPGPVWSIGLVQLRGHERA